MNHYHRWLCSVLLCCTLLLCVPQLWPDRLHAQASSNPTLQITQVETSQFPLLQITVGSVGGATPLANLPVEVTLDGHALPVTADATVQQGIQLIVAIDTNHLFRRGPSGQSDYIEMVGTMRSLVESGSLVRDQDWLAAYQLQGDAPLQPVQAWTQEPNLIFNNIVGNRPAEVVDTPLTAATLQALFAQFADAPTPTTLPKTLLLFTTGAPLTELDGLIAQAQAQAITIHVVALLDAQQTDNADDSLQQLAMASGGRYLALTDPTVAAPLVEQLGAAHSARRLQVNADTATPQNLAVTMTLPDGSTATANVDSSAFAAINVAAVQIALAAPTTTEINWNELAPSSSEDGSRLLPVQATFTWPANQSRQLIQVTYTLRGPGGLARQEIRTEAPFDQATLPLPAPATGATGDEYTLEIMALDELGVESTQTAPTLHIRNAVAAAAPLPTAAPQAAVAATAPVGTESEAQPPETVVVPGLQLRLSRTLLTWLLPVLLLLIGYLIYSERRERRKRDSALAAPQARRESDAVPGHFALKDDSQPHPRSRFQLKPASKQSDDAYAIDDHHLREEAPAHRSAPRQASRPKPTASGRSEALVTNEVAPSPWIDQEELAWTQKDEEADGDEVTVTPLRLEDEEATYRVEEVARPIIGYLLRATSDPNLPKELPIYGLNPAPGQLRQIHIGRHSKHNTVVIDDKRVSREHAVIIQREGRLYLRDNGSTAGTFLNWKQLNPGEELLLRNNDLISFGQIAYEFRVHGEDEATITNG